MLSMYILITTGHVWKSKDLRDHIGTIVAHIYFYTLYIYCMYVLLQCVYVFMGFCLVVLCHLAQVFANIIEVVKIIRMQEYFYMHIYIHIHNNKNYIDHYCIEIL